MLLTVASADDKHPATVIIVQGESPAQTLTLSGTAQPFAFSTAGTYALTVQGQSAPLTVEVVAAAFAKPDPLAQVGSLRDWINPGLPVAGVVVSADSRLQLDPEAAPSGGGRAFRLGIDASGPRVVLARLDDGTAHGAILDRAVVTGITEDAGAQTGIYYVSRNPDGSWVVEMRVKLSSVPPDLRVKITTFASGVMFTNGSTTLWLTAADFDATGEARVRFIMAAGVKTYTCHRVQVYQGTNLLTDWVQ